MFNATGNVLCASCKTCMKISTIEPDLCGVNVVTFLCQECKSMRSFEFAQQDFGEPVGP